MGKLSIIAGVITLFIVFIYIPSKDCAFTARRTTCPRPSFAASLSHVLYSKRRSTARRLPNPSNIKKCTTKQKPWWEGLGRWHRSRYLVSELKRTIGREQSAAITSRQVFGRSKRSSGGCPFIGSQEIIKCDHKNTGTQFGLRRICGVCHVIRTLPANREPRYLSEAVCYGTGKACFSSEGYCTQQTMPITVKHILSSNPLVYVNENHELRVGCVCEIYPGSVLLHLN